MKKLTSIFAVIAFLFIGVQSVQSQSLTENKNRPEVIAKNQTELLTEKYNLDGNQSRAVFRALVKKEVDYQKKVTGKDQSSATVRSEKEKIDNSLRTEMKKILTDEQFKQWEAEN